MQICTAIKVMVLPYYPLYSWNCGLVVNKSQ